MSTDKSPEPAAPATPALDDAPVSRSAIERRRKSRHLAEEVIELFIEDMTTAAARKSGVLTIHDIVTLSQELKRKLPHLQSMFERSFDDYVRARERANWDKIRHNAYERMVVQTFAHLFPHGDHATLPAGCLSRRVLPGFFLVMNMMLGTDAVDDYRHQCESEIERLKDRLGEDFDWHAVYDNADVRAVVRRALAGMAIYFDQTEKRSEWFIDIVNRHLATPESTAKEGPGTIDWELTESVFWRMIDALFADLATALRDPALRAELARDFGHDTIAQVGTAIDRIKARVMAIDEEDAPA